MTYTEQEERETSRNPFRRMESNGAKAMWLIAPFEKWRLIGVRVKIDVYTLLVNFQGDFFPEFMP